MKKQKDNRNMIKIKKSAYITPALCFEETQTQALLCQSGGNESMYEKDYGDGGFTES